MQFVKIKNGSYRKVNNINGVFPVIQPLKPGKKGSFITVDGSKMFGLDKSKIRIKVSEKNVKEATPEEFISDVVDVVDAMTGQASELPIDERVYTEEEDNARIEEIAERFAVLDKMTKAAVQSKIRALIVSGPPGVGKSYGVEQELQKQNIFNVLADGEDNHTFVQGNGNAGRPNNHQFVKGAMTPLGLYAKLYEYSDASDVLVFDDLDIIFEDVLALNILKAALDSGKQRIIHWNADSNKLEKERIPNSFEFKGSVIFITNMDFDAVRSKKLRPHLDALQSRCHYLDLAINSSRDKLLRIKQIARTGSLFKGYGFTEKDQKEVLDFLDDNKNRLRELSLRMAVKIADLKKIFPADEGAQSWRQIAMNTCAYGTL